MLHTETIQSAVEGAVNVAGLGFPKKTFTQEPHPAYSVPCTGVDAHSAQSAFQRSGGNRRRSTHSAFFGETRTANIRLRSRTRAKAFSRMFLLRWNVATRSPPRSTEMVLVLLRDRVGEAEWLRTHFPICAGHRNHGNAKYSRLVQTTPQPNLYAAPLCPSSCNTSSWYFLRISLRSTEGSGRFSFRPSRDSTMIWDMARFLNHL